MAEVDLLPAPPIPPVPEGVRVLVEDIPEEIIQTIDRDLTRLVTLPLKIDQDVAVFLTVLSKQPAKVGDALYDAPSDAPKNVDGLFETIKEGFEYDETVDRGERLRRITDVIDLFTPT